MTNDTPGTAGETMLQRDSQKTSRWLLHWERIKSSRVIQWTVAYVLGILPILELTEMISHAFELPLFVFKAASVVLMTGIPIAAIIAWNFGESASRKVSAPQLLIIMLLCVITYGVFKLLSRSDPQTDVAFGQLLSTRDPDIFYGSRSGRYEIARVLPNQAALRQETVLTDEIGGARVSFDMMANTGGQVFRAYQTAFLEAVRRGVHVRILLADYSAENATNFDNFALATHEQPAGVRGDAQTVAQMIADKIIQIKSNPEYHGSLEIRWYQKPIFYTAWIRDRGQPGAVAHLSVHMYRTKNDWPSFRFGGDAKPMVASIGDDFDTLWETAKQKQEP